MSDLKPCPFCGGVLDKRATQSGPGVFEAVWFHPGVVTDVDCPLSGCGFYAKDLAAWNTRAETPQSIPSEREEIVAYLRIPRGAMQHIADGLANAIERGDHLPRQALEQGSAE